jgi:hypothetical protein
MDNITNLLLIIPLGLLGYFAACLAPVQIAYRLGRRHERQAWVKEACENPLRFEKRVTVESLRHLQIQRRTETNRLQNLMEKTSHQVARLSRKLRHKLRYGSQPTNTPIQQAATVVLLIVAISCLFLAGCTAPSQGTYSRYGSQPQWAPASQSLLGQALPQTSRTLRSIENRWAKPVKRSYAYPANPTPQTYGDYSQEAVTATPTSPNTVAETSYRNNPSRYTNYEPATARRMIATRVREMENMLREAGIEPNPQTTQDYAQALEPIAKLPWESEAEFRARLAVIQDQALARAERHNALAQQAQAIANSY